MIWNTIKINGVPRETQRELQEQSQKPDEDSVRKTKVRLCQIYMLQIKSMY